MPGKWVIVPYLVNGQVYTPCVFKGFKMGIMVKNGLK